MSKKIVFDIQTNTDLEGVNKQINDIIGSTKSLRQQYKELRDAATNASDPEAFDRLARAAGEIKDRIDDANRSIRAFASDTRSLDVVVGSVRGIAGAFAATQGTIALLAGENENLNKILLKVQGSLAVLNGIQQVSQTLNKNSAVGLALYRAQQTLLNSSILNGVKALNSFKVALAATGVGAFVVALGFLIESLNSVDNELKKTNDELQRNKELNDLISAQFNRDVANKEKELEILRAQGASISEVEAAELSLAEAKRDAAIQNEANAKSLVKFTQDYGLYQKAIDETSQEYKDYQKAIEQTQASLNQLEIVETRIARDRQRRLEESQRIDEQNRISLIQNRFSRELALIDARFREERKKASETGADIAILQKRQERDRQLFIQNQQKALGEVILKAFQNVNEELKQLSLTTYREDEAAFLKSQEIKRDKLVNDLIEAREEFIKVAGVQGAVSKEFLDELRTRNQNLKDTFVSLNSQVSQLAQNYKDIEKILLDTERINKRQTDLIKIKAATEGLRFIIDLEEKVRDSNIISGRQAIDNLKEQTGFAENLSKLKLQLIKVEAEARLLEEQKIIEGISVAGDKEIFQRLKNKEIEVEKLTEKQLRYNKVLDDIRADETLSEAQKYQQILKLEEEFIQEGLNFRSEYFKKLNKLKTETLESEIRVNDAFIEKEKTLNELRLQQEGDYLEKKRALLEKDGAQSRVAEQKRQDDLLKLQDRYRLETINKEIELKIEKLKILEDEKKVNPNVNPQLFKEIQNEILDLQIQANEIKIGSAISAAERTRASFESVIRETSFQIDSIGSAYNNLLTSNQQQLDTLRNQGLVSQAEYEKRSREIFENQKSIEVGRTVISTISSAQSAYQSQFVPVPDPSSPVRGAIAAAAALTAGYLRVKSIQNQTYNGGAVSAPNPLNSTSFLRDPGTSQVIEPQTDPNIPQSLRVFVVESDITETQRRVRVIQNGSRTTF